MRTRARFDVRAWARLLCVLGLGALGASRAEAQAELAGTYTAGVSQTQVEVSTWGEDCGQRPRDAIDNSRPSVTVKAQGQQLSLVFPDRSLRTDGCWSGNPSLRLASASAANGRWRAECKTPDSDPKREHGVYSVTASAEGVLQLLEESSYDWQLNASRCVAKVRVTQRVARGSALDDKPEPAPSCTPGPLAKLRLRPSSLQLTPGERSCFAVRAADAAGCPLRDSGPLKWELSKPQGATATLSGGCFKAAASAAEAEGRFVVSVSSGQARDEAVVMVATADLSDITARRGGSGAELALEAGDESAASFGIEAVVKRSSAGVLVAFSALLLGVLAGLTWFISTRLRRRRPLGAGAQSSDVRPDHQAAREKPSAGTPRAVSPSSPSSGAGEQLICPQCRHGYPAGTLRCPKDGASPIPYADFVRKARQADSTPRTCPECDAQLAAGAQFCGVCGAKVHP